MKKIIVVVVWLFALNLIPAVSIAQMDTNVSLNEKQQAIVRISALTAKGELTRLEQALEAGMDAGLSVNQIKEVIVHLYAYAGFPRSIRGLQTFMTILDNRRKNGIVDEMGPEASPIRDQRSRYDRGKANLDSLLGTPQTGPPKGYAAFSPVIEVFLKEHLFADIFDRDVLSYAQRELVTISVLASLEGLEPMLRSHMNICLNLGLTPDQLHGFVEVIRQIIGKKEAKAAKRVLDEVLYSRR